MMLRSLFDRPLPVAGCAAALLLAVGCAGAPVAADSAVADSTPGAAAAAPIDGAGAYTVRFRDRTIDLEPYVQGFPYGNFNPDLEHGHLVYFETTPGGKWMLHQPLPRTGELDLRAGRRLNDIDWSQRNFWGGVVVGAAEGEQQAGGEREGGDRMIVRADERNDERINLYALDLTTGALDQLTDHDYIYGFGLSDDDTTLAYVARHGRVEPFDSCLYVRALDGGPERRVLCDGGGADRLTWTGIEFSPDGRAVIVRVQHDGDRNTTNLARVDLDADEPALELLLERGVRHFRLGTLRDSWKGDSFEDDGFYFLSAQSGHDNLYHYRFADGRVQRLTDYRDDMGSVVWLDGQSDNGRDFVAVVLRRPYESEVLLLEPTRDATGEVALQVAGRHVYEDSMSIYDAHGLEGVVSSTSVRTPFRMQHFEVKAAAADTGSTSTDTMTASLALAPLAGVPDDLAGRIIGCEVERVSFPTFDRLADGTPRMLHAYLMSPKNPPADHERLVRIISFYGGGNYFNTGAQILCAAGIATFSPAPRGSSGFGAEFAALNDGDLGGDEIIDLFYAARFLEARYGYRPHQIGVQGSSHGGYATMRALTFPPHTNERDEHYAFGFGISHAGFSDIVSFYETSNIPDWVLLEAGNPQTEADKLRDRSPLYHVERLQAPILLTHGENDSRVPVTESRRFAARAAELGRPVTYVEFPGQGHGIDGLDNTLRYYRALFDFLSEEVDPRLDTP